LSDGGVEMDVEEKIISKVLSQGLIDVGELRISKTRYRIGNKLEDRFLIYLPINRNYLWRILHKKNIKVRIFIEIPAEVSNKETLERFRQLDHMSATLC
jgi:hypothetical protein